MNPQWSDEVKEKYIKDQAFLAECTARGIQICTDVNTLKWAVRKQEPVGWMDSKGNMICTKINESCKPLYTSPQQRTWVGLTDEEIDALESATDTLEFPQTVRAIEAKLKEKNT